MPHLSIEYSSNIEHDAKLGELCAELSRTLVQTGLFELGAIRVRALRADVFTIADALPQNGFADLSLRIGAGRSLEEKRRTGEALFAVASKHFAPLFTAPHFALSLEIREIDAELSWKKNAIHPRLRGK
ncbi:MAG: 5-carboxymethyl-2-hydroxymuconate Delta-isomerase [Devosia sp.]